MQIAEFRPQMASIAEQVDITLHDSVELLRGEEGMVDMVTRDEVDLVVVGTTGRAGLLPTIAALEAGKLVALANKEVLVSAGHLIQAITAAGKGSLVPIDSEHSRHLAVLAGRTASVDRAPDFDCFRRGAASSRC